MPAICLPGVFKVCSKAENNTSLQLPANRTDSADQPSTVDQPSTNLTTSEDDQLSSTTPAALENRDLEKRHNWALVCGTRGVSASCSKIGYSCSLYGRVIKPTDGLQISQCERDCTCKNIGSLSTDACLISPKLASCYGTASDKEANNATAEHAASALGDDAGDNGMTDNANITDSMPTSTTSLSTLSSTASTSTPSLVKRHDYALVCNTRAITTGCSKRGYACTSTGGPIWPPREKVTHECEVHCSCEKIGSVAPNICLIAPKAANCIGLAADEEATGATLEDVTIDGDSITTETQALTTSLSSVPSTSNPTSLPLVKRHSWALICYNKDRTIFCGKRGYTCSATGRPIFPPEKKMWRACDTSCLCRDIGNLNPNICLTAPKMASCFSAADETEEDMVKSDDMVTDDTASVEGIEASKDDTLADNHDTDDTPALTNSLTTVPYQPAATIATSTPTPSFSSDTVVKRHNWALVCLNRELTSGCQEIGYHCNAVGGVGSTMGMTTRCNKECKCMNVGSLRADICAIAPVVADCFGLKDTDGVGSGDPGPVLTS